MATEEEEDGAFASGLGVGIWHDDEEIDMNIALWTTQRHSHYIIGQSTQFLYSICDGTTSIVYRQSF